MSFINERIDPCVGYGFTGGPEWATQVVVFENGREKRNAQWMYPRHRYSAVYRNLPAERRQAVLAAFHAARGQLYAFRFKDWNDYTAANEPLLPNVGTADPVQLIKTYSLGNQASTRLIQAPVAGTVTVLRNGFAVAGTLDDTRGLFTPDAPWEAGTYTWSGQFDVWVRFASDYNAFALENVGVGSADVELIEVRR